MSDQTLKNKWAADANRLFVGKQVARVRYLTDEEVEGLGWYRASAVFEFTDGTAIYFSQDDEGNDAGSCFTTLKELPTIPVI